MSHDKYLYTIQVVDTGRVMTRVYPTHFEFHISPVQLYTSPSSFAYPSSAYALAVFNPLPFLLYLLLILVLLLLLLQLLLSFASSFACLLDSV